MPIFKYKAKKMTGEETEGAKEARDKFELARGLRQHKTFLRPKNLAVFAALSGIALLFGNSSGGQPLFQNTDNFVLFGQEEIKLEQEVQVSSGDLGSNKEINIEKDAAINGNLFSDKITIGKNTTINGNVSYNKLNLAKESQILGTQTKPIRLPIANLSEISEFQTGTQDFKFEGQDNTLSAGNYRNITLEKDSRLILSGVYNLNKLELKENSTLIFNAPTTINIQFKLKGQEKIAILPGQNLKPDDLKINYLGIRSKHEKDEREEDDNEINALHDDKEKKDHKQGKTGRPIVFGKDSFLNFKLLAPKASVHIEKESTLRGQALAKKIRIGKNSILSREEIFAKESDPKKVVIDADDGSQYVVNEIMVNFVDSAAFADAQAVADLIEGQIVGFVKSANTYQIEVFANTTQELSDKIWLIRQLNSPLIEGVFRSYILELIF